MQTGFGIAMRRSTMFSLRPAENQTAKDAWTGRSSPERKD
jgi:hypothetical protein